MKTTVEIPDPLLSAARKLAEREGTTVKALIERGLRQVLAEQKPSTLFQLRAASFRGNGLQRHLQDASWERLRELAYEGRGE